ncbi:hypothetical protein ACFYY5_29370 [Nocardia elegans]|uniref:XRE family transcriptional regulator n=1 Tax=Nocardia elegans TaxID=300029 RepID=A0ABW6TLJ4_9NOCA
MSTFDELEAALGIDMTDPREQLAAHLVAQDDQLLEALVGIRIGKGIRREQVADAIGCPVDDIEVFETVAADIPLSVIRRYALAVGARITHTVESI